MSQQWYYSKNGQQQGPVSPEQLKQLATAGTLQPTDLVWKEGMSQWVAASSIKGLFAAPQTPASQSAPPPPPAVSSTVSPSAVAAPALWNPKWIGVVGFFLTWGFGAWLLNRNWNALGDPSRAKRSLYWLWGFVGWLTISLFLLPARILYIPVFLTWLYFEVRPQVAHVRNAITDQYVHRGWGKPVGIAIGCGFAAILLLGPLVDREAFLTGWYTGQPTVNLVRLGSLRSHPKVPLGKAIDNYLESPRWEAVDDYVNVRGGATLGGKRVNVLLQFKVNAKEKTFYAANIEANDVSLGQSAVNSFLEKAFEQYKP